MIGGKVVDASALAAWATGSVAAEAWFDVARRVGIVMLIPQIALDKAGAVLPWAREQFAELLDHPTVIVVPLGAATAAQVARRLDDADVFDGVAGHVAHIATERGWPALSADTERLLRVDRHIETEQL